MIGTQIKAVSAKKTLPAQAVIHNIGKMKTMAIVPRKPLTK